MRILEVTLKCACELGELWALCSPLCTPWKLRQGGMRWLIPERAEELALGLCPIHEGYAPGWVWCSGLFVQFCDWVRACWLGWP